MNQNKVQLEGKVPFSWENKPGVSKLTTLGDSEEDHFLQKLPPPPCPLESAKISIQDMKIPPPPPCAFKPPSRTSSRRSDDPFLAAYKKCTKSTNKGKLCKTDVGLDFKRGMFYFSCIQSCSVRVDNLVRVSQLPLEKSDQV